MVRLAQCDIRTRDVTSWTGIHVFHTHVSSCSQKLRVFLNFKGLSWTSHPVDVANNENLGEYYLGINPRGLVPTLIHDGEVHIESNDIILHLESAFPKPPLIPQDGADSMATLLRHEDDLHLDLRTLTFRFLISHARPPKSADDLKRYAERGSGTVLGVEDSNKRREIQFWRDFAERGITDDAAREAADKFRKAFQSLDDGLARAPYLLGRTISILDIAWLIYVHRLALSGYPLARLHPHVTRWYGKLSEMPQVAPEIALPVAMVPIVEANRLTMLQTGRTLEKVCAL